jgi:TPR repeat protein
VAASKGDDEAAFSLALACFNGKGVEKSQTEGVRFCRLAAERGNHRAQYSLGYWYYHGTFLPQSFGDAFTWFRKSAVKGHPYAQSYVGLMYLKGQSVTQSDSEARRWFEFSVNHGSGAGHLYLAQLYFDGKGVAKDDAKALGILTKGALLGHSPSQAELGRRLEAGDGVVGDPVEASAWYDLAVRGGEQDAKPARDALYRSLSAAQVSTARARAAAITSQIEAEEAARRSRP